MKRLFILLVFLVVMCPFIVGSDGESGCEPDIPPQSDPDFSRAIFINGNISGTNDSVSISIVLNQDKTGTLMHTHTNNTPGSCTGTWQVAQSNPVKANFNFPKSTSGYNGISGSVTFYKDGQANVITNEGAFMGRWHQE
ncbi:MAG: hypothetical protein EHM12_03065 [Dehalococcoidia bacterium]|nr:MAG: hypothetical protein EHM12_03065 [Dehalococcoidia bacterium]